MKLVATLAVTVLLAAFNDGHGGADHPVTSAVEIRVRNVTDSIFNKTRVSFSDQIESYGVLLPGEVSTYRKVAEAYRYAAVVILSEDKLFLATPIDYVGEKLLKPGKYTYELRTLPEAQAIEVNGIIYHGSVDITLKADADDT